MTDANETATATFDQTTNQNQKDFNDGLDSDNYEDNVDMGETDGMIGEGVNNAEDDMGDLLNQNSTVESKTFKIYEKSRSLDEQQSEIDRKQEELHTKQKQIEMGIQKNRYRRNMIWFLILANLVLLGVIFFFWKSAE